LNVRPEAAYLRDILAQNENNYCPPYTPVLVYGNHDHQRLMSRIRKDDRIASLLAVFKFTARGVPVIYYGEEIGMSELFLPKDEWIDPVGMRFSWLPGFIPKAMKINPTRDGCRSPMQWKPGENAGFTSPGIKPWLPLNEDIQQVNVSTQLEQPGSLLNTYRQLLQIRTAHPALQAGKLEIFASEKPNSQLLAFTRIYEAQQVLVLLNFGTTPISFVNHTGCQQVAFKVGDINQDRNGNIEIGAYASAIITN
jgi:glycosidase